MTDPNRIVFAAAAFAARAHRNHLRKDDQTPYVSHPFRVCLVVRQVFGFDDPKILAAALLHDTIEDTTTDCDDLLDEFGPEVARWVAAVSKDSRLPFERREAEYREALAAAEWQAKVVKLADLYDNLGDTASLNAKGRRRTVEKSRGYLEAVRQGLPPEAEPAAELVGRRVAELEAGLTT